MGLTKSKGNMFKFISHTWNPVKGRCSNNCTYCYMKRFEQKEIRLDEKELKTDLGSGNFIFICSGTDLFAPNVSGHWIYDVINHANKFNNKYLIQTKNPLRLSYYLNDIPIDKYILSTTIETDKEELIRKYSNAPSIHIRHLAMEVIRSMGFRTMITVEPVLDFDVLELSSLLITIKPEQVNIGADSRGCKMPEPESEKIEHLIRNLERQGILVHRKDNLKRLIKGE